MHITIEIDDGNEQSRVTVTGAPTGAAAASDGSEGATAAPLDAGPAPDIFAAQCRRDGMFQCQIAAKRSNLHEAPLRCPVGGVDHLHYLVQFACHRLACPVPQLERKDCGHRQICKWVGVKAQSIGFKRQTLDASMRQTTNLRAAKS